MSHSLGIAPTAVTLPAPDAHCRGHMPPTFPESIRRLLTCHDSSGYFAIRYGYAIIGAIQPNDTSQPSAQEIAALIDQIAAETAVTLSNLLDEGLPGKTVDPGHTCLGMMEENMRTQAATLGGAPSLMDGEEVGNAPGSE